MKSLYRLLKTVFMSVTLASTLACSEQEIKPQTSEGAEPQASSRVCIVTTPDNANRELNLSNDTDLNDALIGTVIGTVAPGTEVIQILDDQGLPENQNVGLITDVPSDSYVKVVITDTLRAKLNAAEQNTNHAWILEFWDEAETEPTLACEPNSSQ